MNRNMQARGNFRQSGLSLIELMVSLVVGLLVTGIVVAMFTHSKRSFIQDDAVSVMQENGRFALQTLSNELLHAGLAGNMHLSDDFVNDPSIPSPTSLNDVCTTSLLDVVTTPIEYYETPPPASNFCIDAKPNTHVLIVKHTAQQPVGDTEPLKPDTLYLGTDGIGGGITVNQAKNLLMDYWEYYVHIYYIDDGDNGVPGLFRKRLTYNGGLTVTPAEEIVPGIADFAIQYGVDDDNNNVVRALGYTTNLSTANSPFSVTARISVLAQSLTEDFSKSNNRQYSLSPSDTSYVPAVSFLPPSPKDPAISNYYGRVFTTSVMVRNNAYRMSSSLITVVEPGT